MERAYPAGYGMTAIIGMTQRALERLIAQVNSAATPVFLANINAETQMVVAGSDAAMQRLATLAIERGAQRCERLDVAVPSHCALLDEPAAALADAFAKVAMHAPRIVYLSSSIARPLFDGARIAADLAGNMARQVRWHDTMRLAWERGARLAIEMPPANVLTRLSSAIFTEGIAVSCSETALPDLGALDRAGTGTRRRLKRQPALLVRRRQTAISASRFGSRSRARRKLTPIVWRIRYCGLSGMNCTLSPKTPRTRPGNSV